jgi:murein L,D-transpeptidase YcbB/YkuD
MENRMKSRCAAKTAAVVAVLTVLGGCTAWHQTDRPVGTAAGAVGGAVAGAAVAGPVGAVAGGVGGAYVGHETTGKGPTTASTSSTRAYPSAYDTATIARVQQALNARGYHAGPVDGQWGQSTMDAVRRFQQAAGLPVTGELGPNTLNALGVA